MRVAPLISIPSRSPHLTQTPHLRADPVMSHNRSVGQRRAGFAAGSGGSRRYSSAASASSALILHATVSCSSSASGSTSRASSPHTRTALSQPPEST